MSLSQSTNHILVLEPIEFRANEQTKSTNSYQEENPDNIQKLQDIARAEFRGLRDMLVDHGVVVTTALGQIGCPDDIFCNNWVSTHLDENGARHMVLYPMLAQNRRPERRPDLLEWLGRSYETALDLSAYEDRGQHLESTGSLVMDRVNKRAYCALSARSDDVLARKWCETMGYELIEFNTIGEDGIPVYHTDVLMYVGSGYVGICLECILDEERDYVRKQIESTHEIIELSMEQMSNFAGNALEIVGESERKYLAMSQAALNSLNPGQKQQISKYVHDVISAPIPTIEKYGGGSVRCMLLELH